MRKMKKEELMIGDWVMVSGIDMQVAALGRTKAGFLDEKGKMFFHEYENIHPIPLTDEILEKNGLVKASMVSDTPPYDKDEEGNMHFSLNEKIWGWWQPNNTFLIPANGLGWLEFKYVHELQHALKLCGINKEIEP